MKRQAEEELNSSVSSEDTDYDEVLNSNRIKKLHQDLQDLSELNSQKKQKSIFTHEKDLLSKERRIKHRMRKAKRSELNELCRIPEIYVN